MHVIKGGWVGQTFALAKCNDSGGKKSRIRRSKEERKALVESFIKKYQKLNNGSFPSLNLTHKEVGGSFYTVREIVREVIQENKVLGPAKLTPEQQNLDDFLDQNPIGSMSIEPKTELLSPNDSHSAIHIVPNHHLDTSEELVLNANAQCLEPEHQNLGEGLYVNGSNQAFEKNEEYDRAMCVVSRDTEFLKLEGTVEDPEASKAKITHVAADLMVETFPLTSGSGRTYGLDENSCEASVPNGNSGENEGDVEEMEAGNKNSVVDGMNFLESAADLRNERTDATLAGQQLEKNCDLGNEQPVGKVEVPLEENPKDSMTKSGTVVDTSDDIDCEVKDASSAEIMVTGHPHGIHAQSTDDTKSSSSEQSIPTKALASESNPGLQLDDGSKESNPTLDRMNLESWKTTSDQPHKMETNPILAFFKSFLAAFVKFWSE